MADSPKYRDEDWLRKQYRGRGREVKKIASECDVDRSTIYNWLDRHDIPRDRGPGYRTNDPEPYRDEDWLWEKYHAEGLSTRQIATLADCTNTTIRRWLDRHGIETRSHDRACSLSWEGDEKRREFFRDLHSKDESNTAFYDTSEWKQTREEVFRRDDFTCQECGVRTSDLHAHHLTPVSEGGEKFDLDNLTTLCRACHAEKHPNRALLQED